MTKRSVGRHIRVWIACVAVLFVGCVDTNLVVGPVRPASETMSSLVVSPPASIVAIGSTQQLTVAAVTFSGVPVTEFDSVLYVLNAAADSLRIGLSSRGLVTGRAQTTNPALVNVFAFKDGVARGDQVLIQVRPAAITGLTLSIQPVAPDSAKLGVGTSKTITPVVRNPSTGVSVPTPAVRYKIRLEDRPKVTVFTPVLRVPGTNGVLVSSLPQFTGVSGPAASVILGRTPDATAWIFAEINAFGVLLRDSVLYTFTSPVTVSYDFFSTSPGVIRQQYKGTSFTIAQFGTVTWFNRSVAGHIIDVEISDPAAALAGSPTTGGGTTGNVVDLGSNLRSSRQFTTPGTYKWIARARSTVPQPFTGADSGILIVK